jgi:hypothetical protein
MKPHGWTGLAILAASEVLLLAGVGPVAVYFTPLAWTGYILALDAWIHRRAGSSPLVDRRGEFFLLCAISVAVWYLFEGYNLLTESWRYRGLPDSLALRYAGYVWAFATILPGMLLTAELLESFAGGPRGEGPPRTYPRRTGIVLVAAGAACLLLPFLFPSGYLIPLVWVGFVPLLDPILARLGGPTLLSGRPGPRRAVFLAAAGLLCGFLWEFWNYWAEARWVYSVPYLPEVKLFEMPVLGYLGFPPFALEGYLLYHFLRRLLPGRSRPSARSMY